MEYLIYHFLALGILFFTYELLFKQTKWFVFNRIYLLGAPILPFLLSFWSNSSTVGSEISAYNPVQLQEVVVGQNLLSIDAQMTSFNMILWIYFIGVFLVAFLVTIQYWKTFRFLSKEDFIHVKPEGYKIAITKTHLNFSFFNYIVLNEKDRENQLIIEHELRHVRSGHSFDLLLMNLYKVIFWFNPFIYLIERRVQLNHEFEADHYASRQNQYQYANNLLNQVFGTSSIQFINQFNNQNSIKMRIKMLKQQSKRSGLRYLTILPLLGFLFLLGSWNTPSNPISNLLNEASVGEDQVYDEVDKMPEFKGGMEGLVKYMQAEVKYPKTAEKENIQGKVFVEFIVDSKGNVKDAKVKKGADELLNKEALRVVSSMPKWTPGEKEGKKVNVRMILPVVFKL